MPKRSLVVVESPTKVKTIQKYLDGKFIVKASMGHVRDLPKSQLGVDPKKNFKPKYVISPTKQKVLEDLKKAAEKSEALYVATDPDREGEAIGWHLAQELAVDKKKVYRITFNEITERAVKAAFTKPGKIDMHKVDAQQARRVLDRLVGYSLSPLLWEKVQRGLSAGRVQSVAVRLIVDRQASAPGRVDRGERGVGELCPLPRGEIGHEAPMIARNRRWAASARPPCSILPACPAGG